MEKLDALSDRKICWKDYGGSTVEISRLGTLERTEVSRCQALEAFWGIGEEIYLEAVCRTV
jgi:hypothetical protein